MIGIHITHSSYIKECIHQALSIVLPPKCWPHWYNWIILEHGSKHNSNEVNESRNGYLCNKLSSTHLIRIRISSMLLSLVFFVWRDEGLLSYLSENMCSVKLKCPGNLSLAMVLGFEGSDRSRTWHSQLLPLLFTLPLYCLFDILLSGW